MKLTLATLILAVSLPLAASAAGAALPSGGAPVATTTNQELTPVAPGALFTNSVGMELVKVGSFWAGKFEVTQKEYQKISGANPSAFAGDNNPVDSVSWNDAMAFCAKLTEEDIKQKKLPEGFYYTLPTESEWQSLLGGATLDTAVTSQGGRRTGTATVGSLAANSLGLYDVRGNVMEFTLGDASQPYRTLLGGSWQDRIEINLRPEFRYSCRPDEKKNTFGFRCVLKEK